VDVLARALSALGAFALLAGAAGALAGCQAGYLIKSAAAQADILRRQVPLDDALADPKLSEAQKSKLRVAREAKAFGVSDLGLKKNKNYEAFAQLDRPYASYVVHGAARDELKPYLWKYPIVGEMPYKGYPDPEDAKEEAARLRADGYDAYVRGVSAYSTLGWLRDPILSSMLQYEEWDLVNTILHESTHATIFIRSEAGFNERLATFIGNKGTEAFYAKREGPGGATLAKIRRENEDERVFSEFISRELRGLEKWYDEQKGLKRPLDEAARQARIKQIQERFAADARPRLSPGSYNGFETAEMNNARLLTYRLYMEDLSDFERAFAAMGRDMPKFVAFCKRLEAETDPVAALRAAAGAAASAPAANSDRSGARPDDSK
jgi:predicted aminopeptidase